MARPVNQEKRLATLDAAARAFLEKGYEGTSVDLVADSAGVARRTVYHQFGNKDGLFAAVAEHVWGGLRFDMSAEEVASTDVRSALHMIASRIVEYWRNPVARDFLRLAIVEGPRFPKLLDDYFRKGKLPVFNALTGLLQSLARSGKLNAEVDGDPALAAQQLIGLLNEPLLWPNLLGGPEPSEADRGKVRTAAVDTFLARYGARS